MIENILMSEAALDAVTVMLYGQALIVGAAALWLCLKSAVWYFQPEQEETVRMVEVPKARRAPQFYTIED